MPEDVPTQLVQRFVDMLHAQTKRISLDAAYAEAVRLFGSDPSHRVALLTAMDVLRARIDQIEHLKRPATLKRDETRRWYPGPQDTDEFWPALKGYLEDVKRWEEAVIAAVDDSSSKVVSCLDFPGNASFSTRGLVLGYVQSGKTANFTAVISKAADVGFKVFIILSGLTNSLRRQTQERLIKELVRLMPTRWQTWTDADKDIGDYPFNIDAMLSESNSRHLAVVKKNGPRLRRLLRMFRNADERMREKCPVLIIDDECDQASVNASGQADKVTVINRLLRDLLRELPRVCYVGYTATPYANVLIDPSYEDDLYPRDFIVALPRPSSYFGAERLFGRDLLDADPVPPDASGLNMIRSIDERETPKLRPESREQKDTFILEITPSLEKAIRYYLMATAAKAFRGLADDHSCMLIHTTVYVQCHLNAKPVIETYVRNLMAGIDKKSTRLLAELAEQWREEMELQPSAEVGCQPVSFDDLRPHLAGLSKLLEVVVENSLSDERLDFSEPARRYIVIGGNVLARGLTIEGLVVSYFLRTASQYDTLMQMGRWFGYRIGYADLPRIWMTPEMADYFKDMATVEAEIRRDIEVYDLESLTPLQFAVRIRMHPDLNITAPGKMAAAEDCQVSFSGQTVQTRKFHRCDNAWLQRNWMAADGFVSRLGAGYERKGGSFVFKNVEFTEVIRFLADYQLHNAHERFSSARITEYIRQQNRASSGSLAWWNVCVVGQKDTDVKSERALGRLGKVSVVTRSRLAAGPDSDADIKALVSRQDALLDIDAPPDRLDWNAIHELRREAYPEGRPLLLLYPIWKVSPPQSKTRRNLDAVHDVMGMSIVFPAARTSTAIGYTRARIDPSCYEEAEYQEEVLPDDDTSARNS